MKKILLILVAIFILAGLVLYFAYGRDTFRAFYSWKYRQEHQGVVDYKIPEVFELANIAVAISRNGLRDPYRVNKSTEYYRRVYDHFSHYKEHELIKEIDRTWNADYYVFLNGALCYSFNRENNLIKDTPYKNVYRLDVFDSRKGLLEDFARVSGFRGFYQKNLDYYHTEIKNYQEVMPARKIWNWLEKEFPLKIDSYLITFSPLLGSTHNTFSFRNPGFKECVMVLPSPDIKNRDMLMREIINTRVVFTEIDHNYVNRITDKYRKEVSKALQNLTVWNENNSNYDSPYQTFNEYLTWAVFNLYAHDNYPTDYYRYIENNTNVTMLNRKFSRFKDFNNFLLDLYLENKGRVNLAGLYPRIIRWFADNGERYQAM